jgi:hypothetical protein
VTVYVNKTKSVVVKQEGAVIENDLEFGGNE